MTGYVSRKHNKPLRMNQQMLEKTWLGSCWSSQETPPSKQTGQRLLKGSRSLSPFPLPSHPPEPHQLAGSTLVDKGYYGAGGLYVTVMTTQQPPPAGSLNSCSGSFQGHPLPGRLRGLQCLLPPTWLVASCVSDTSGVHFVPQSI